MKERTGGVGISTILNGWLTDGLAEYSPVNGSLVLRHLCVKFDLSSVRKPPNRELVFPYSSESYDSNAFPCLHPYSSE